MEYTQAEIMAKMEQFVDAARRVKELKDYLLDFKFISNDVDFLEDQMNKHDETIEAIGRIYDEEMTPLVEEMAAYLNCHREDFEDLLNAEREMDAEEEMEEEYPPLEYDQGESSDDLV